MMSAARGADHDRVDPAFASIASVVGMPERLRHSMHAAICSGVPPATRTRRLVERLYRAPRFSPIAPGPTNPMRSWLMSHSSMIGRIRMTSDIDGLGNERPILAETETQQIGWRADCQRWQAER